MTNGCHHLSLPGSVLLNWKSKTAGHERRFIDAEHSQLRQ